MKEKKKRGRQGLSVREARTAVTRISQGEAKERVMRDLGYAETTARSHPERLDQDPNFKKERTLLQSSLLAENPDIFKTVAQRVNEGLNAKKQLAALVVGGRKGDVVDPEAPEATGRTKDFIEVEDYAVQLKFCEFVSKAFGQLKDKDDDGPNQTLNVAMFFQLVQRAEKERGL